MMHEVIVLADKTKQIIAILSDFKTKMPKFYQHSLFISKLMKFYNITIYYNFILQYYNFITIKCHFDQKCKNCNFLILVKILTKS